MYNDWSLTDNKDWWNVVTPLVDYLESREDVDMSKLALAGISFGGQLAPLAASQEHRFSALILIDGLKSIRRAIAVSQTISTIYQMLNSSRFNFHPRYWSSTPLETRREKHYF